MLSYLNNMMLRNIVPDINQKGSMKKILSLIFLLIVNACNAYIYDLSLCAVFKNEGPYLKEWIEYHRCVGVKHFYLFNHESTDNYFSVLKPYIDEGIVELEDARQLPDFNGIQIDCYNRGLIKSRGISCWVGFIDIDEFIIPSSDVKLSKLLSLYLNYAGVAVNWRCFGTSNIEKLDPNKPMVCQLIMASPLTHPVNAHIKSIVRPELAMKFRVPHHPIYIPGWHAVNVDMAFQEGSFNEPILTSPIHINHYWTRDEYYLNHFKKPRRLAWGNTEEQVNQLAEQFNTESEPEMKRYKKRLKKALGIE